MRNSIVAATIGAYFVMATSLAHARWNGQDGSRSPPTIIEEQSYFPLCSLPFERLVTISPNGIILIKICT
ncbi:hypothetical protein ABIF50_000542 [Bradyrhizobium diazoefficiens]